MVEQISRDLDDVGPLNTVSPTRILRQFNGHADAASADALARMTGAGLAIYGSVAAIGPDSVRFTATLRDVAAGRAAGSIDLRTAAVNLTDSATTALLRELGRVRTISATRTASLGSRSLPALKAFFRAEQFYRRAAWDSAEYYATRAVQIDSTFALARARVALARAWNDKTRIPEGDRAWQYNHGLAPRDSLLLLQWRLQALAYEQPESSVVHRRRAYGVLQALTSRYPDDPEAWFQLGEFIHHSSGQIGIPGRRGTRCGSARSPWTRGLGLPTSTCRSSRSGTRGLLPHAPTLEPTTRLIRTEDRRTPGRKQQGSPASCSTRPWGVLTKPLGWRRNCVPYRYGLRGAISSGGPTPPRPPFGSSGSPKGGAIPFFPTPDCSHAC
jgi:hypothetical protein